ncbi:HNH endonuclease signature motif containing protein [Brachybacterium nesterenkovii]|uniref:HNH endonuclease signature motif containing protein n=1 Tax=Brachybacterium nesterenkovii TaxID=47847 RepID=UPI00321994A7
MTRDVLGERADAADDPRLVAGLQELWDDAVLESRIAAARMRRLDAFWVDGSASDDAMQDRDEDDMRVAIALRISPTTASHLVHEAHLALTDLPGTFALLEAGTMPWPWMRRVIRAVRDLETEQRHRLDAMVAGWDLDVTFERFRKDLALAASRVRSSAPLVPEASPAARRRAEVHPDDDEGMACLRVVGPVPDVMALARRLDASARAVQAAQRRALEVRTEGDQAFPIPYDDGTVEATGRALSLARLRFDLLTRSPLDAGGAEVPAERFRINVVVPAMTLLGVSDAPGTLDGTVPVPAELARSLAGGSDTWYRVLTDPVSGAFLPLPADRYVPTPAMREHLRLRSATCAAPGCTRPSSWASECDHIEEFDHRNPFEGGRTEIENLHLLCWQHHLLKTRRRIDPVRLPQDCADSGSPPAEPRAPHRLTSVTSREEHEGGGDPPDATGKRPAVVLPGAAVLPGGTRWSLGDGSSVVIQDDVDLLTPDIVADLEMHWHAHTVLERRRDRGDGELGRDAAAAGQAACGESGEVTPGDRERRSASRTKASRTKASRTMPSWGKPNRATSNRAPSSRERSSRERSSGGGGSFRPSIGPPPF